MLFIGKVIQLNFFDKIIYKAAILFLKVFTKGNYFDRVVFDKKEKSKIIFKTPQFFIDKFGIHSNFQEIFLVGKFSEKKVADMLPNDYVLK